MDEYRKMVVSGASGLVGSALAEELEADGVRVLRLVRKPVKDPQREVYWKPSQGEIDAERLEGVDAVFHLAGKGIADKRWTPAIKQQIVESRTRSTRLLAEALAGLSQKPRVLVSASATGFYGDRGAELVDEDSPVGNGFLAETCKQWEASCQPAWEAGLRVVQTRIGLVLSPKGGALAKLLPLFRKGLGGTLGRGDQYMSWIALYDLTRVIRFVADHEPLHGVVNTTTPGAVTNRQFTKQLGGKLGRPTILPVPVAALKLAMGEMAGPLLLEGANVWPKRLLEAGFQFETPDLPAALDRLL
jgi:uncharacterized protein (TIGR01777 family)